MTAATKLRIFDMALSAMDIGLEGYEKPSGEEFGQEDRIKCLDWFKQNQDYKFRKIDYFGKDTIISRMGHLIFCVN